MNGDFEPFSLSKSLRTLVEAIKASKPWRFFFILTNAKMQQATAPMTPRPHPSKIRYIVIPAIVIFLCWASLAFLGISALVGQNLLNFASIDFKNLQMDRLGQTGDLFGALNTLLTGFVLVSALYAAVMQHHQITLATDHFEEECRRHANDLAESKRRFDAEIKLAKEHSQEEEKRTKLEVKRVKLEEIIFQLDSVRQAILDFCKKEFQETGIASTTLAELVCFKISPQLSKIRMLAEIYFPDRKDDLMLTSPLDPFLLFEYLEENPMSGDLYEAYRDKNRSHLQHHLDELSLTVVTRYNDAIADFHEILTS